ncbi:hypothetical protein CANCADRAFT_135489 [Tortispora caseinolytica NRRL Y-17796]|uniref:Molybdenum cofactor biosynthesis protein MoaE n=1 Tax=Tortispora caseinolytica NRRL Y-17796 TaxID=767744 RepID=A0A1E4TC67_9ASCO|nr:hypothetical protein CANCADRAFT_135489 [Tortispora caseinolytica NRRL Y-17796]
MDKDLMMITAEPISPSQLYDFVRHPECGAIVYFGGTTRGSSAEGEEVVQLSYEAYEKLALRQLQELANKAREKWPVRKVAIAHRLGNVPVTCDSVGVAVSTPHRKAAFEACEWLIDELKANVAIWKGEELSSGERQWIGHA